MKGLRQFLGAVGLLIVAICGSLALLSLVTDPGSAPTPLMWTGLGLILWSQAIASQVGLGYRVTFEWLLVLIGIVLGLVVIFGLFAAGLGVLLGSGAARSEGYVARFLVYAIVTAGVVAWARGDPRRAGVLRALGRAALARASSEDSRLLAGGPGALFRARPTPDTDVEA